MVMCLCPPSPQTLAYTPITHPTHTSQGALSMSHQHHILKTHITITEYDDVDFTKLGKDRRYFGEGNSKGRVLEYDFEYCIDCGYRRLNGQPVMTKGILEYEFERFAEQAK